MKDKRSKSDIVDFSGGLATNVPTTSMDPRFTPNCLNVYAEGSQLKKRAGISKLNSSSAGAASNGNGIFNWVKNASQQVLVSMFGNSLYKMDLSGSVWDGTWDAVSAHATSGTPTSDAITHFITYAGTLLWTTEVRNKPQRMGASDSSHFNIEAGGSGTSPNGKYIQVWKDHVWVLNIGAGGLLTEDFDTISGWDDDDTGTAASTQATFQGFETAKFVSVSGDTASDAIRTRDVGDLSDDYTVEFKTYFDVLESVSAASTSTGYMLMHWDNGLTRLQTRWSDDGLEIYDGAAWNEVGVNLISEDTWYTWKFVVSGGTVGSARVDVLRDGVFVGVGLDMSSASASTASDGQIQITATGSTGTGVTAYMDYMYINSSSLKSEYFTDGDFGDWDSATVPTSPNLVAEPTQPLTHFKMNDDAATTVITDSGSDGNDGVSAEDSVVLMINFNGADAATTHTASTGQTVTFVNNAELDTAQKQFGSASLLLDGTDDYVTVPDSADWTFGTKDFTIDLWVRFNNLTGNQSFAHQFGSSNNEWSFFKNASGNKLTFQWAVASVLKADYIMTSNWSANTDQWYHLAAVRNGSSFKIYIDGVSQTLTEATAIDNLTDVGASVLWIGDNSGDADVNGWIDEFRVTTGAARWTSNFTAPTSEIVVGATETITASGKVSNSISFSSASGHNIQFAAGTVTAMSDDNVGTLSAWVKADNTTEIGTIFSLGDTDANSIFEIRATQGRILLFASIAGVTQIETSTSDVVLSDNSWTHIAITQNATTSVIYVNGSSVAQTLEGGSAGKWANDSGGLDNGRIGCHNINNTGNTKYFNGDIDDVRYYSTSLTSSQIKSLYADGGGTEAQAVTSREGTTFKIGTFSYEFTNDGTYATAITQTLGSGSELAGVESVIGMWVYGTNNATYKFRINDGTSDMDSSVFTANGTWQYQTFNFTPTSGAGTVMMDFISTSAATFFLDQASIEVQSTEVTDDKSDRIQRSAAGLYDDWDGTDSGTNDIITPGDIGLTGSFIISDRMYVTKAHSIHRFTYTGSTPLVDIKEIRASVGTKSPRSIRSVVIPGSGEIAFFLGTNRRLYMFDGFDSTTISDRVEFNNNITSVYMHNINTQALDKVHAVVHNDEPWYELFIPIGSSTVPDHSLVYDYITKSFWPFDNRSFRTSASSDDGAGKRVTYVQENTSGFAYLLDDTTADEGVNINSYWLSAKIGDPTTLSKIDELNIITESVATTPIFSWREDFTTEWTSVTLSSGTNKHNYNPGLTDNYIQYRIVDDSTGPRFVIWGIRTLTKGIGHGQ